MSVSEIFSLSNYLHQTTDGVQINWYFLDSWITINVFVVSALISIYFFLNNPIVSKNSYPIIIWVLNGNIWFFLLYVCEDSHYHDSFFYTIDRCKVLFLQFQSIYPTQPYFWNTLYLIKLICIVQVLIVL